MVLITHKTGETREFHSMPDSSILDKKFVTTCYNFSYRICVLQVSRIEIWLKEIFT